MFQKDRSSFRSGRTVCDGGTRCDHGTSAGATVAPPCAVCRRTSEDSRLSVRTVQEFPTTECPAGIHILAFQTSKCKISLTNPILAPGSGAGMAASRLSVSLQPQAFRQKTGVRGPTGE